jgi:D-sedoheptulose 7-phosphate isomerase
MDQVTKNLLEEASQVHLKTLNTCAAVIDEASSMIIDCMKSGNKVLLTGNGGSCSQAIHISAEFTGRYKLERKGLPAIALTTDPAAVTAISNDYGYEKVFSRQVEALGKKEDILISISTSGNSKNVINAIETAKKIGLKTINVIGKDGGKMKGTADIDIIVPSDNTPIIQSVQLTVLHILCEIMENRLFK